jgi:hypothetical protein
MTQRTLKAIKYDNHELEVLDQLQLPHKTVYIKVENIEQGHEVIKSMKVLQKNFLNYLCFISYLILYYRLEVLLL